MSTPRFRMTPGLEERRIAAVVGALVADAAGMLKTISKFFFRFLFFWYTCNCITF